MCLEDDLNLKVFKRFNLIESIQSESLRKLLIAWSALPGITEPLHQQGFNEAVIKSMFLVHKKIGKCISKVMHTIHMSFFLENKEVDPFFRSDLLERINGWVQQFTSAS